MTFMVSHYAGFDASVLQQPIVSWNPADKSANQNLSNSNRTATNTVASFSAVRTLQLIPNYKVYFELTVDSATLIIGVAQSGMSLANYVGSGTTSWGWQVATGSKVYYNAVNTAYTGAGDAAANDIIMIAIDMAAQKFWGGRNGTWHNSGAPASGTGNAPFITSGASIASSGLYLACSNNAAVQHVTIRQTPTYQPPSGFLFHAGNV